MSLNESLFLIYIIIGICVTIYDWENFRKYEYEALQRIGESEDSMVIIYWIMLTLCWPIKLFK